MITVEKATNIILDHIVDFGQEEVALEASIGRVLKEKLTADRDFPPFHRVTMDGVAIRYDAYAEGLRAFYIQGLQAAGNPQEQLKNTTHCIEVMTGAMLPDRADTVIPYEQLEVYNGHANILTETVKAGQNIHRLGEDRKASDMLVDANRVISSAEIGVAATVGKSRIKVAKLPKVVVVSTGDELVSVDEDPLPFQIRSSNVHQIRAILSSWGIEAELLHIRDDEAETFRALEKCVAYYDVIILSGGVSKGKLDFVPGALTRLDVKQLFHRVKQRPGKPFWFGMVPDVVTVFALPGNPVSSFMCVHRYFVPWLRKSMGLEPFLDWRAVLTRDVSFKPDLTYFAQVKLVMDQDAKLLATPIEGHGSGDLANLVDANAFMELPGSKKKDVFKQGEVYRAICYRD